MNQLLTDIGGAPRTRAIVRAIQPYLRDGSVLDIGAGACQVARYLHKKLKLDVTAVDVVDHNLTKFPLVLYDGKRLPYKAAAYDTGLLVFVLHHAPDITGLLREARRVSKRVIVIEDTPVWRWERWLWRKMDYFENHAQHADIDIAHEALTVDAWRQLFEREGCTVVTSRTIRSFATTGLLYPHTLFVLETARRTALPRTGHGVTVTDLSRAARASRH